jgi:hypothetical protein
MIQPTRLLIDLAQNSRSSSQRNRLVARSSEPFAVTRESHILPLCSTQNSPSAVHQAQSNNHTQLALSLAPPIHQTKPIGHGPSSGLALCIFSSPARLRSRFLPAYSSCRRAAKLKILCIMLCPPLCGAEPVSPLECGSISIWT